MPSNPTGPSDDRIRDEVHRVADRVRVDSERHLAELHRIARGRRGWFGRLHERHGFTPLAAALSVAGVVVVGTVVTGAVLDGGRGGSGAASVSSSAPPASDISETSAVTEVPDGRMPSVFGHTEASARSLLTELGLDVRLGKQNSCDAAGRPVGSEPAAGAPVRPGDRVTLLIAFQGPVTDCSSDLREPWRLVDFATGRGPAPKFSDDVRLFVDGTDRGALSANEAARGDWGKGSALELLAQATRQVAVSGDAYASPSLQLVTGTPPDSWCGVQRPAVVGDREASTITIAFDDPGLQPCPVRVALYKTAGEIDTVVAWSSGSADEVRLPIPDVVGLDLTDARRRITAAGHTARTEQSPTCHPRPGVVEQAPTEQALRDDGMDGRAWTTPVTLVVEVVPDARPCGDLDAAADAFLAFARGGPPPSWAPEVQQLLGYTSWASVTAEQANEPDAWALCSGVAPADCTLSPLAVAAGSSDVATGEYLDVSRWPSGTGCELIDRGALPDGLGDDQIVLYPAKLSSCDQEWAVTLWIDDAGRITAVNLLVPSS
ncbi:MAG: PASTA domain-containing protein [Beijerinckiaceae bacterium]|nr:PASTA domain-containing protein [Beijerinckiaceae bacterium]